LLPTPQARDHHGAQLPEQRRAGGHQVNLNDVARGLAENWQRDGWGRYEPAIRRWEAVTGRAAPFPAQRGRSGRVRISAEFTEWCQGLPAGWVAGIPGLPYAAQIRALGNGVVPAQADAALRLLIQIAAVPGSPADLTWPHEKSVDAAGPGRKASRACTPAAPRARGRPAPSAAARAPESQADGQLAATLAPCSSSKEAARAPRRDAPGSRPAPAGSRGKRDCR
jgi:hypothetical protein